MTSGLRCGVDFVGTLLILACVASQARGGVLKVDDSGGAGIAFTQIGDAVAAAVDGDVILVQSGTYSTFTVDDKSLVIHADLNATVTVTGTIAIRNLAAGKSVLLRGIDGTGPTTLGHEALVLDNDAGFVRIEDGTFAGGSIPAYFNAPDAAIITNSASIAFLHCTIYGGFGANSEGGNALHAKASTVVAGDCTLAGGTGGQSGSAAGGEGYLGGTACWIEGGSFSASGSQLNGGAGGYAWYGGYGGDGLRVAGGALAQLLGNTIVAGPAGFGMFPGAPGVAIDATGGEVTVLNDTPRHYTATSPGREGSFVLHEFHGLPNEEVFLLYSLQPGQQTIGAASGSFLIGSSFQLLDLGGTDVTGTKLLIAIVPELGPGIDALTVHCQAAFAGTGGGPVLGGMSIELLLDKSL